MRLAHRGFVIDDRLDRFDFARCHGWLAQAYWSAGITREEVEHGFRGSSFVAGAYLAGEQVGCLRLVTDFTRFAYFMDVYVAAEQRGRGLGRRLVRFTLEHPRLALVNKWTLATADAHGVYAKEGFVALPEPNRWMALGRRRDWLREPRGD
jgi:GNAT superfamily N-acetyltransferase